VKRIKIFASFASFAIALLTHQNAYGMEVPSYDEQMQNIQMQNLPLPELREAVHQLNQNNPEQFRKGIKERKKLLKKTLRDYEDKQYEKIGRFVDRCDLREDKELIVAAWQRDENDLQNFGRKLTKQERKTVYPKKKKDKKQWDVFVGPVRVASFK
jgi:hypothetical protein